MCFHPSLLCSACAEVRAGLLVPSRDFPCQWRWLCVLRMSVGRCCLLRCCSPSCRAMSCLSALCLIQHVDQFIIGHSHSFLTLQSLGWWLAEAEMVIGLCHPRLGLYTSILLQIFAHMPYHTAHQDCRCPPLLFIVWLAAVFDLAAIDLCLSSEFFFDPIYIC